MSEKIVILGGGESGVGAALLAKAKGYEVFLSDAGSLKEVYKAKLQANGIAFEENTHTEQSILEAKEIIKSPGIPDDVDILKKAQKLRIPVISEIEFAGRYTKAKKICITGTNGKTTTTLLTYHLLSKAGYNVGLAGNVGKSFAELVLEDKHDYYVLELSSFQLDGMYDFKADVAILTNITPDHLDRYDYKVGNYVKSKFRVIRNMDASGVFIYGEDSPLLFEHLFQLELDVQEMPFSIEETQDLAAYGNEEKFYINPKFDIARENAAEEYFEIDFSKSVLKGKHNLYNAMAAGLAAAYLGLGKEQIEEGLRDFTNADHRMQVVGEINGVVFINDSKATNVDSAWYALDALKQPIVWIAGGVDKGNDYKTLYPVIQGKVKALVCLGKENGKLFSSFKGKIPQIKETQDVNECVRIALEFSSPGDAVLLSPCCASFDLFKNYEDRGAQFSASVKAMMQA